MVLGAIDGPGPRRPVTTDYVSAIRSVASRDVFFAAKLHGNRQTAIRNGLRRLGGHLIVPTAFTGELDLIPTDEVGNNLGEPHMRPAAPTKDVRQS